MVYCLSFLKKCASQLFLIGKWVDKKITVTDEFKANNYKGLTSVTFIIWHIRIIMSRVMTPILFYNKRRSVMIEWKAVCLRCLTVLIFEMQKICKFFVSVLVKILTYYWPQKFELFIS